MIIPFSDKPIHIYTNTPKDNLSIFTLLFTAKKHKTKPEGQHSKTKQQNK